MSFKKIIKSKCNKNKIEENKFEIKSIYCFNNATCFYIFHNGIKIDYSNKQRTLDDIGKSKIKEIILTISDLKPNYLETPQKIIKMFGGIELFPYKELIFAILEILDQNDLEQHQIYICLKILQILDKNEILQPEILKHNERILNVLLKIYFKHFTFQKFILSEFIKKDFKNAHEFVKRLLLDVDVKSIMFYFSIFKYFNHFDLLDIFLFNEIKNKINKNVPKNEIESTIKKVF